MSQILSHAHVNLIISGHRFVGFADEDRPVEFGMEQSRLETSRGHDGGLYGTYKADVGGMLTVRLAPNSPSAAQVIRWHEEVNSALLDGSPFRIHAGTYMDTVQGRSASFAGGLLDECPAMVEPGVTFEFTMQFERITPSVDAGRWLPPLESAA